MTILKRVAAMAAILCLLCGLCACTQPADDSSAPESSDPTTTTTTKPADDGKVTYTVTVTDQSGAPIANAVVQICSDTCMPAVTNASGVATWTVVEDDYKVSFPSLPAGYLYSSDEIEYYFEDDETEMTIMLLQAEDEK